jgi:tetratricopeptide (TPR) repeat protein
MGPSKQLLDAVAAHRSGDLGTAEAGYRAILRAQANNFDATQLLGAVLAARGRNKEAEALLRRAVTLNGNAAAVHNNLGNAIKAQGRVEESLPSYNRAIALDPQYVDAITNRGNVYVELERPDDALADYERALTLQPNSANTLLKTAKIFFDKQQFDEALVRTDRALALGANTAEAWMRSGNVLFHLDRHREALESYDKVLAINPGDILCAVNRSGSLSALGRPQEALEGLDRALAHNPGDAGALNNKATILKTIGRLDEALETYRVALAANPNDADTQSNYAMTLLLAGDMENGFPAFEHRWRKKANAGKRPELPFPEWGGEPLQGRSILIFAEQGLGDIVQFSRYLPLLKEQGADVGFLVSNRMHQVLRESFPQIRLFNDVQQARTARFDVCCAMMSLPLHFRTRLDTIPVAMPYLKTSPERLAHWRDRIGADGFKVGICWQGNPFVAIDAGRSFALEAFAPLANLSGVRLISLQKNDGTEQLADCEFPVETLGDDFDAGRDAFVDTTAVMQSLDLVIAPDTSIAHVAGALGRPVWVALKHVPDWRWMLGRDDSPWYPTLRLFRQTEAGNWQDVFMRIKAALVPLAASGASPTSFE